jgi:pyruvate,water dikinase
VDTINLKKNRFEKVSVAELLGEDLTFPCLDEMVSMHFDGHLEAPATGMVRGPASQLVVTFDKFLRRSTFPQAFGRMLRKLEQAYKCPVDVEFAFDGETLYILQCRPQAQRLEMEKVNVPEDVPRPRQVFTLVRHVPSVNVADIEYVVYIDPRGYDRITNYAEKTQIARVVGKINNVLAERNFILMGPGRWGSNDVNLGVRVTYADINNARVLIEVARIKDGYTPEVSYGTHFFQDLVEDEIAYLPLFPDEPGVVFNEEFLGGSPNLLTELLPDCAEYAEWIRVIDVPASTGGGQLHIMADADSESGMGFIEGGSM